jgi:hypothetical protein
MKLVIQTQVRENYGAHDWDGKGECPQHWKCKGGDTYVVPNLTVTQVLKIKDTGIPTLKSLVETSNESFQEYVIDWSIMDDDATVCEEWETPFELFYEQGRWVARRTVMNDAYGYMRQEVAFKTEQYDMQTGGERANYDVSYTFRDGRVLGYNDTCKALKELNAA